MHLRASYNGILVTLETLTPGKQQEWLDSQAAVTPERVKRLIRVAKDEEKEE